VELVNDRLELIGRDALEQAESGDKIEGFEDLFLKRLLDDI
jgi:hypothetical protein